MGKLVLNALIKSKEHQIQAYIKVNVIMKIKKSKMTVIFVKLLHLQMKLVQIYKNIYYSALLLDIIVLVFSYKWNLLMPISLVDENMKRAQKRDAVINQKFYWRSVLIRG